MLLSMFSVKNLPERWPTLLVIGATIFAGCAAMSEKRRVKSDFLSEHPTYTVISIGEPDGNDTSVVTFFIRYKKPGEEREFWSDWAYETKNGKFELVEKGTENVYIADAPR